MSKDLSQIVADLFAKATEGNELSSQIHRFGDEIRKAVHGEETLFGKYHGLLESFREVIPDEQQRYQAALKALSTTSKLSRQEIMTAINGQVEELKILENGLMSAQTGWRDELKAMEARSQELKGELAKLRERIAQLESEEQANEAGMAARKKDQERVEKTIRDVFADIRTEISAINKKMEELPAEYPVAQPTPQKDPVKNDVSSRKKEGGEQKIEIQAPPVPEDTKFQRKCPMCGGRLNLLELEHMWQCYTCAYEEPLSGAVQGANEEKSKPLASMPAPASGPTADPSSSFVDPSAAIANERQSSSRKKPCPSCRKTMFYFPKENAWRCPSCQYERRI